ncbi:MAG: hypothetical protein A2145_05295 [candidate division Zixibacteria bacterium RBG_16_40_9]|nr:MAG: hypothetical protein A2145_05295 [candidate division Zixibacteria bacterium RBG_16_40_9]
MASNKLYVGNLNYQTSEAELREIFSAHGQVVSVTLIAGKGFGFVEMDSPASAQAAKEALNGTDLQGRALVVDEARPPKKREGGGGGRGGYGKKGGFRERGPRW